MAEGGVIGGSSITTMNNITNPVEYSSGNNMSLPSPVSSNGGEGGDTTVQATLSLKDAKFNITVKDVGDLGSKLATQVSSQIESSIVSAFDQLSG